jgi:hypothetical protein
MVLNPGMPPTDRYTPHTAGCRLCWCYELTVCVCACVCVRAGGRTDGVRLGAWNWSFVGEESHYSALFPRAWTVYDEPEPRLRLTSRQISPVHTTL